VLSCLEGSNFFRHVKPHKEYVEKTSLTIAVTSRNAKEITAQAFF
jgi:hypothetical protein